LSATLSSHFHTISTIILLLFYLPLRALALALLFNPKYLILLIQLPTAAIIPIPIIKKRAEGQKTLDDM
jgi:hypothetical protein